MDKLQPQTVYVPVPVNERLPEGEKDVFVLYDDGDMNTLPTEFINKRMVIVESWLEKQEGVYPLTGKELAALLKQTWQEAINWADKDNGVDMTDAEEDGPIMNFSDYLKQKGIEI